MASFEVTCVTVEGGSTHSHITVLGVGGVRRWPVAQAIEFLAHPANTLFAFRLGHKAIVQIYGTPPNQYLQTSVDGVPTNHLLDLPRCI